MTQNVGKLPETGKRSLVSWILLIGIPFLIIVVCAMIAKGIIDAYDKPEERKRNFNTLSVLADYARIDDVQLKVEAQGEVRPQIEINLVPQVGGKS